MNLLAVETSSSRGSVALCYHGKYYQAEDAADGEHARAILPLIQSLLHEAKVTLSQLDGFVFGQGPGSFTGLRIACSVVKGLALATNLPVYPVSGLAAIALHVQQKMQQLDEVRVLSLLDARMQQVYWGVFDKHGNSEPEAVSDAANIHIAGTDKLVLAGVGWEVYLPHFSEDLKRRLISQHTVYPMAEDLIKQVLLGKILPVTAAAAEPVYLRNQVTQGAKSG